MVVGDGERALEAVLDLGAPRPGDAGYRMELASIPGIYVPGGYLPEYSGPEPGEPGGVRALSALRPLPGFPLRVRREAVSPAEYPSYNFV